MVFKFIRNILPFSVSVVSALAFVAVAQDLTTVQLRGRLSDNILEYAVNRADDRAGGKDTVTIAYSAPVEAWVSIGFTNGNGLMVGADAVVGLPRTGEVKKYFMSSYENSGVLPMPEEQQTLIDTSVVQEDGTTTMKFTKILNETGEIPISIGPNTFIAAYGMNNFFFYHEGRDAFDIDLVAGEIEVVETRNRSLWKAHGWCAALAWGVFSPLAIGVAMLRYWFPNGLWLKIHQYLNYAVVVTTILAFVFGVVAIQSETPSGGNPNHFSWSPSPHRLLGLVLFLFLLFQTAGGKYRPNNPSKGEEKTLTRRSWEILHRVLGLSLVAISWYQIESGITIYQNLFADSASTNLSGIFWGLVGTISGIIIVGFLVTKIVEKSADNDDSEEEEKANSASSDDSKDIGDNDRLEPEM